MLPELNRRSFVTSVAATGAFVMAEGAAAAAASVPFFRRVRLPIGLQVYLLGDELGRDLDAGFAQAAQIGYREIELPHLYGRTPAQLRAAADKAGLAITGLHLTPSSNSGTGMTIQSPASEILDVVGVLGSKCVTLPIGPYPDGFFTPKPGEDIQAKIAQAYGDPDYWRRLAAQLNEKGAAFKAQGVSLSYHNHNFEFRPIGDTSAWKILSTETDPKLVYFEVDIGWLAAAGIDPVQFLRRYRGRVAQLHVKDLTAETKPNFVFSIKATEVGSGKLDWKRILPAAYDAGARHFYVEQEPPFVIPRIEAARKSYNFLSKVQA